MDMIFFGAQILNALDEGKNIRFKFNISLEFLLNKNVCN